MPKWSEIRRPFSPWTDTARGKALKNPYAYVIMHAATKNRSGVVAAQSYHAGTEALGPEDVPLSSRTTVAILELSSSEEIEILAKCLAEAGVPHALLREPAKPWNGAVTALATPPLERDLIKPYFAMISRMNDEVSVPE